MTEKEHPRPRGSRETGGQQIDSVGETKPRVAELADFDRPPRVDRAAIEAAADIALATGRIVVTGGVAVVPDVFLVERAANGEQVPPAPTLIRPDGRMVALYRLPDGAR